MNQRYRYLPLAFCVTEIGCGASNTSPPQPPSETVVSIPTSSTNHSKPISPKPAVVSTSLTLDPGSPRYTKPLALIKPAPDDPMQGEFTLEQATKGLTGSGHLVADIETTSGTFSCDLFHTRAPITVANFVGLARGLRPWKDPSHQWVKRPLYDRTFFHRVIAGFMIQGGDPNGNGAGDIGYVIPDELWQGALHDRPGLLCMANRGADTGASQFFITASAQAHLDKSYTIFGYCTPEDLIHRIAATGSSSGAPSDPTYIVSVSIRVSSRPLPLLANFISTLHKETVKK